MESRPGKLTKKNVLRAATVFTGAAAATVAFAPTALANTKVPMPYRITAYTAPDVHAEQVCGYKDIGSGEWTCTSVKEVSRNTSGSVSFGNNWRDGKVNVWVWYSPGENAQYEAGFTCNTNGAYYGHLKATGGVSLTGISGYAFPAAAGANNEC